MTFHMMALIMTAAGSILGARFLFAGGSVLKEWGMEVTTGGVTLARRMGALYLGLALMFFIGRGAEPSEFRSAVCLVMAGTTAALAGLGLYEYLSGRVKAGVFRSVVSEAVLAAAFAWLWWSGN
jgi:hypothetical protein